MLDKTTSSGSASTCSWRLNILELLRPEDELEDLLASGDFRAASALANKHKLPNDTICRYALTEYLAHSHQGGGVTAFVRGHVPVCKQLAFLFSEAQATGQGLLQQRLG